MQDFESGDGSSNLPRSFMDTFIGYNWVEYWAYCKKCDRYFKYGYNSAGRNLHVGDERCPKCKSNKDVETEEGISFKEDFLMHILHNPVTEQTDEIKDNLNRDISQLGKIRNKFKELRDVR